MGAGRSRSGKAAGRRECVWIPYPPHFNGRCQLPTPGVLPLPAIPQEHPFLPSLIIPPHSICPILETLLARATQIILRTLRRKPIQFIYLSTIKGGEWGWITHLVLKRYFVSQHSLLSSHVSVETVIHFTLDLYVSLIYIFIFKTLFEE